MWALLPSLENVDDLEIKPSPAGVEHELDHVRHLPPGSVRPSRARDVETEQTSNHEPVFIASILHPVVEFGINCNFDAHLLLETAVTILEIGHPILVVADLLLNQLQLGITTDVSGLDHALGLVKEVEKVMEPGDGGQKAAIWQEVLTGEAWQK